MKLGTTEPNFFFQRFPSHLVKIFFVYFSTYTGVTPKTDDAIVLVGNTSLFKLEILATPSGQSGLSEKKVKIHQTSRFGTEARVFKLLKVSFLRVSTGRVI